MEYPKVDRAHIVPRTYLRNFAVDDRIAMQLVGGDQSKTVHIDDAAVRKAFYRRTRPDGSKIDDIEWSMAHLESTVTPVLRNIEDRWPLTNEDKAALAEFCGLQILRTPRWQQWHDEFVRAQAEELRATRGASMGLSREVSADEIARFERKMSSDTQRLTKMLELLPKVSSILGGMHWSLVRFDHPLLATSDHPVHSWLFEAESAEPHATRMGGGLLPTLEVRIPLSPCLALLMTWIEDEDPPEPLRGLKHQAKNLNAFLVAQAEKQWFHRPGNSVPIASGQLTPLSPELFSRYDTKAAYESRLRAEVSRRVQPRIGSGLEDRNIEMVRVRRDAA